MQNEYYITQIFVFFSLVPVLKKNYSRLEPKLIMINFTFEILFSRISLL